MYYYEVIVNSPSYKGREALTYQSETKLADGSIVQVPLRRATALGIVARSASKPRFATKPIENTLDLPAMPNQLTKLAAWLSTYYPSGLGSIGQQFVPKSLTNTTTLEESPPLTPHIIETLPALTDEQNKVISSISKPDTYTLHGETGTGKTRVYIELAQRTLSAGRSVIILTPEISLTPQLARNFKSAFGEQVLVTHSRLTEKQRRQIWLQILSASVPLLVIGPRSALFTPLKDLGLIVMDESHEPSYKQEQSPHYLTSKVAAKLAELHGAALVLGSATPSISDYFMASQRNKPVLRMTSLAQPNAYKPPAIEIVDLRNRSSFTRSPYLSDQLLGGIDSALRAGEQSLLFLNRRGTARIILCDQCGWQAVCEHCNLPLTYHGDSHIMRCHTCGHTEHAVTSCPVCRNPKIILKSIGTKAIVDTISSIFPSARVQRFDTDNKKSERIEQHYMSILSGNIDIIVGTQILAKGLDLPKLSVVGVVIADTSLNFPDYTADERTYQLLRQVIGRVGRGHRESSVILQTYDPSNFIVQAAANNAWGEYYERELAIRQKFLFPPFCFILKLTCRRASSDAARKKAEEFADTLRDIRVRVLIDGPSPTLHEKVGNKYQWQLIIKAKQRSELIKIIEALPSDWSYDIDPLNLL
ncbi:MAG: primosomal protein N' [Candidatus Saccharimonadales bacterium]|jgi:primosomal protein N' (replication factor Y)